MVMSTPLSVFKRMNFFTGFFTTAKDWNEGQEYHLKKRRLHNQGLHTPGIVRGLGDGLVVQKDDRAENAVSISAGVAIDGNGNEICLHQAISREIDITANQGKTVYVVIIYSETLTDMVENKDNPRYSGPSTCTETPIVQITTVVPNNTTSGVELARIRFSENADSIKDNTDPSTAVEDVVDLSYTLSAGAVFETGALLSPEEINDFIGDLMDSRTDFVDLQEKFPVSSNSDLRHALLMVEMLLRSRALHREHVASVMSVIASLEREVEQDLADAYPELPELHAPEFGVYHDAVDLFIEGINSGMPATDIFTRQSAVSEAARGLLGITLEAPVADPGPPQTVSTITSTGEATVLLDASGSKGYGDRPIVAYHWNRSQE
jgi:hypothetical protein